MVDLLSLIPEATSAIAVIIVVVLFLRHQQQSQKEFTTALESQRHAVIEATHHHLEAISEMLAVMRALEATANSTNTLVIDLRRIIYDRLGLPHDSADHGPPSPPRK
jgi:hypothetical protein